MALVIPAEGPVLERVLDAAHAFSPRGLSRHAFAQFDAAQMKTAWGRRHQRRFALVEGGDVLASAVQYDLAAVLDEQPVRVCGIAEMSSQPARASDHFGFRHPYSRGAAGASHSSSLKSETSDDHPAP